MKAKTNKITIVYLVFSLFFIFSILFTFNLLRTKNNKIKQIITPTTNITIDIVDTPTMRQKGLSGRESLSPKSGMLFVFDSSSEKNCFWMKDMKFAIDMVWIDDQKNVVTVTQNVGPDTYPSVFCPEVSAKYGLEINAFSAEKYGIKTGEKLSF